MMVDLIFLSYQFFIILSKYFQNKLRPRIEKICEMWKKVPQEMY